MPCFSWKNRFELNMDELRRLFYGRRQNWTALYWIESNNSLILLSNVFMIIYLNSNYTHHHRLSHSFPGWSALMSRSIWRQWASIKREECDVCYWGGAWSGKGESTQTQTRWPGPDSDKCPRWRLEPVSYQCQTVMMSTRKPGHPDIASHQSLCLQPQSSHSALLPHLPGSGGVTRVSLLEHC